MTTAHGRRAIIISDNLAMTGPSSSPLWRILCVPFTRRTWVLGQHGPAGVNLTGAFLLVPIGAATVLAAAAVRLRPPAGPRRARLPRIMTRP